MTTQIDTATLRQWLESRTPVTVLDIRTDDERAQWAIPGSIHANAYDALKTGRPGVLASLPLPPDRPVITVCGAGHVSQIAADLLAARGFDARSLAGGMKAWSLAWNTADVSLRGTTTALVQVRRTGKGCVSYVLGSENEAIVIDPSLSIEVYLDIARRRGWRIRHVLETHIHADHLSRARQLATDTGASLLLPDQQRTRFSFLPVADGDRLSVGAIALTARRTPGHTDESTSYVLDDELVFTGDTLFTTGVGRPDLHADQAGAVRRARMLFHSVTWLRSLGSHVLVCPAHTSAPVAFDERPVIASVGDIDAWLSEWIVSEQAFVERLVSRLPAPPPNFTRIVDLNERGESFAEDATTLEAGANRCAVV